MIKKILIAAVAAVILAVALEYLQVSSQPKLYDTTPGETTAVFQTAPGDCTLVNCSYDGTILKPEAGDPQLYVTLSEPMRFNQVSLLFSSPIVAECPVQIYYEGPNPTLSEVNSVRDVIPAGSTHFEIGLENADYTLIRADIDGETMLESIRFIQVDYIQTAIPSPWHIGRMALIAAILFGLILPTLLRHGKKPSRFAVREMIKRLMSRRHEVFQGIATFLISGVASFFLVRLTVRFFAGYPGSVALKCFYLGASFVVATLVTFRKAIGTRTEVFFLVICLSVGTLLSFFMPDTSYVSWDDEIHYRRAINVSYIDEVRLSYQDKRTMFFPPIGREDFLYSDETQRSAYITRQDEYYHQGAAEAFSNPIYWNDFAEIPAAIGLYLGRVARLSYHYTYVLGRWCTLLAYSIIGYFAIRRLKSGKLLMTTVLLIPTGVFLASNYSYDPWMNALSALGFSYYFAQWQEPDKKLRWSDAAVMVLSLLIACLTKGVYFLMLLVLLLLPRGKYRDMRQKLYYYTMVIGSVCVLIASFLVFTQSTGISTGDMRGGTDVNAPAQIRFVLTHPLFYSNVMIRFLAGYLNPARFRDLLTSYYLQGEAPYFELYLALLAVVAFTDHYVEDGSLAQSVWTRVAGLLILIATIVVFASSMYAAFTPVGAESISGCQTRYMMPVVFPALMLLGSGVAVKKREGWFANVAVLAVIAFVNFSGVLVTFISMYH